MTQSGCSEPDHGLDTTGMDGGRRKGGKSTWPRILGAQEHPVCSAVSVRVNHSQSFHLESWHTVCEWHTIPGGGREAKGQHWWKVQEVNAQPRLGDWQVPSGKWEPREPHTAGDTLCSRCTSGCDSKSPGTWPGQPLSLSFHSHTSLEGKKKPTNCSKCDGLHFTLLPGTAV